MARRDWLASMLESSVTLGVLGPEGILRHAPAKMLVETLPSPLVVKILDVGLEKSELTPTLIVETVGMSELGVHLPENTIWAALVDAGASAGLGDDGTADGKVGEFLTGAVQKGFETGQLSAEALLTHCTPSVLASNLPPPLAASLLQASLEMGAMSPKLIVETLGVEALSKHLPKSALWACVCDVAAAEAEDASQLSGELELDDLVESGDTGEVELALDTQSDEADDDDDETLAGELELDELDLDDDDFDDDDEDSEVSLLSESPHADKDDKKASKKTASGAPSRLRSGLRGRRRTRR